MQYVSELDIHFFYQEMLTFSFVKMLEEVIWTHDLSLFSFSFNHQVNLIISELDIKYTRLLRESCNYETSPQSNDSRLFSGVLQFLFFVFGYRTKHFLWLRLCMIF